MLSSTQKRAQNVVNDSYYLKFQGYCRQYLADDTWRKARLHYETTGQLLIHLFMGWHRTFIKHLEETKPDKFRNRSRAQVQEQRSMVDMMKALNDWTGKFELKYCIRFADSCSKRCYRWCHVLPVPVVEDVGPARLGHCIGQAGSDLWQWRATRFLAECEWRLQLLEKSWYLHSTALVCMV